MFGVRITSLPKTEQSLRISQILSQTNVIKTESDFRKIAADIFPEFTLFSESLDALNIGIVSQWYSVGPETIWKPQDVAVLAPEELKTKAPRFFEPTQNPAAIEFWYTKPTDHWYKIYVSDKLAEGYFINPAKYLAAANRLNHFRTPRPA